MKADHTLFLDWLYACGRKRRFDTSADAAVVAWEEGDRDDIALFVYQCDSCSFYHLTKNDPWAPPYTRAQWMAFINGRRILKPRPKHYKDEWLDRWLAAPPLQGWDQRKQVKEFEKRKPSPSAGASQA